MPAEIRSSRALPGIVELSTTPLLSHKILIGLQIGTPIDFSVFAVTIASSTATLNAANSAPKVDVSTEVCRLENHL